MPDIRDFLPQPPWEGPPIPGGLIYRPKFVMYHATPMKDLGVIMSQGLIPQPAPRLESPWSPGGQVTYLANRLQIARDYAYQVDPEGQWTFLKIEYDEFPGEIYPDLLWGLPGTYYTRAMIPAEHITPME